MQEVLFHQQQLRRERSYYACTVCNKTTEHVKEAGSREFKCQDCETRRKHEAQRNQGAGI